MIPQDVMPVVFLEGTDYEMGYQYGMQLSEFIPSVCIDAWVRALERGDARHPTAPSREAVLKDLAVYKELLGRHMPEQLEQIRGMADALRAQGKAIEETDLLLVQAGVNRRLAAEAQAVRPTDNAKSCTTWSAWGETTKGGQLICSDSFDGDFTPQVCLIAFPREGTAYVTTATIGELSSHFAYSYNGLFFGNSGGNGRRLVDWGYGLRWTSVVQHCVRFADSPEAAQRLIASWPHAIPENYHLVDKTRRALVVELTADLQSVRRPGDYGEGDFLYSTNNFVSREMRVACDPETTADYVPHGGWPGNAGIPRNLEIWYLLTKYAGHVDLTFSKMMWRFPGNAPPAESEAGWGNMICRMSNTRVAVVLPDEGEFGEVHVCTGPVGRIVYQFRSSTFPVQGTHCFVRIPLRASPEETVEAMYRLACDDVALAHHVLSKLTIKAPGYFGLREIQRKAHGSVYEGKASFYEGLLASPSDLLPRLSRAASSLALAQAHSGEVRELITPPPTSPGQMGLEPWRQDYSVEPEYGPGFPQQDQQSAAEDTAPVDRNK